MDMSLYNLFLFLHVTGAVTYYAGVAVLLLGLGALRRARQVEQARALSGLMQRAEPLAVIGGLLILGAGSYMTATAWGWSTGWILVTLVTLIGLGALAVGVIEPRRKAIRGLAKDSPDGPLPEPLKAQIHDPILGTALHVLAAVVVGIIFLMTVKPELVTSILVIGAALALGLISSVPLWRGAWKRASQSHRA
jgi:hypothetical protein